MYAACFQRMVVHPNSPYRASWDMASLFLVLYDMVTIPLHFFELEDNAVFAGMAWCTRLFWSSDFPYSFFTGFLKADGTFELRCPFIAKKYVRSWCFIDLSLISIDWMEVVLSRYNVETHGAGYGRLGKVGRIFRIMRMMRLLRLARMRQVIRNVSFRIHSEKLSIVADIVKILMFILGNAHLLACFWYGIGTLNEDSNWLTRGSFDHLSLLHRYMLSLHWSLALFQGGMDEIVASNILERIFNVVAFLLAFMVSAVCISALTSSMTRLHILASRNSFQLNVLRRYLVQNHISEKLIMRVHRNAVHALSEHQRLMSEEAVELLHLVSEPLRVELHFEMYCPVFEVHPFFEAYAEHYPHVMQKVCHTAITTLLVSAGDIIFNEGEIPVHPMMYIICSGVYNYESIEGVCEELGSKQWLTEAALWTAWMHRGTFTAMSDGRVCALDAAQFQDITNHFDHPVFHPRAYAQVFVQELNRLINKDLSVTDLALGVEEELIEEVTEAKPRATKKTSVYSTLSLQTLERIGLRTSEKDIWDSEEKVGAQQSFKFSVRKMFSRNRSQEQVVSPVVSTKSGGDVTKTASGKEKSRDCVLFEESKLRGGSRSAIFA